MACTKCKWLASLLCLSFLISCTFNDASNDKALKALSQAPQHQSYTVEIKDMKFVPDSIVVKKGDEIVFLNKDIVDHCVTEEKSKMWTSGAIHSDQTYSLVVQESSDYYCAIHKVMKGKIIVQ